MKTKKSILLYSWILATILSLFACIKNTPISSGAPSHARLNNQSTYSISYEIITIVDKTFQNKLTLRISCKDSTLLIKFVRNKWQLIIMNNLDIGTQVVNSNEYPFTTLISSSKERMRIEIIKSELQPEVVGYYIANENINDELNHDNSIIISEFISEKEVLGGYLQICNPHFKQSHAIWMSAITLDDPSVHSKELWIDWSEQNKYISIGFLDPMEKTHAWSVIVKHDITIFPIVYWMRASNLP